MKAVVGLAFLALATMAPPVQACDEVSDVVGYRRCASFGEGWDLAYSGGPPLLAVRRNPFARRSYRPGTLTERADDASSGGRDIGCIDLRAERVVDPHAPPRSVVVAFALGNGCDRVARVALQSVRATAVFADGRSERLALYDPASEVGVATLDARDQAREVLQFDPGSRQGAAPASVCLDVSAVAVDGPRVEARPLCLREASGSIDEHEVIGHNWLYSYGRGWDLPGFYFFAELGAVAETVDLGQGTYSGTNSNQQRYSFPGNSFGRGAAYGFDWRLSVRVVGPLYAGLLLRAGGGHLGTRSPLHVDSLVVHTESTFEDVAEGGLVGVMFPRFAGIRVRGEVAAGVRVFDVDVDSASCRAGYVCAADYLRALLEPRVVVDAWLNPWWSTSAWLAIDALHPDGAVGLSIAFHLRSFDGAR